METFPNYFWKKGSQNVSTGVWEWWLGKSKNVLKNVHENVHENCPRTQPNNFIPVMSANIETLKRAQKWHENVFGRIGNLLMLLSQKMNVNSLGRLSRLSIPIHYPSIPEMAWRRFSFRLSDLLDLMILMNQSEQRYFPVLFILGTMIKNYVTGAIKCVSSDANSIAGHLWWYSRMNSQRKIMKIFSPKKCVSLRLT